MSICAHNVKYTNTKELSVELEFIVACSKISGNELIIIKVENTESDQKFKNAASRLLKSMKKDGVIQLFVFADELALEEKTESVYLLNKFPDLIENCDTSPNTVYIKI